METFNKLLVGYPGLMYSGVGASAFLAGGALIYRIATRKKPTHAKVNCWFCNENTVVPYVIRNSWDCPNCEQYNGFQENGDYNKPILAQYNAQLNYSASGNPPSPETPPSQWVNSQMLLCKKCNKNQSVKIKQLASFIPKDDDNYDEEIEAYKHHLEQTYKLCRPCQTVVEYYIKYQNRQLRNVLLNHQQRRIRESDTCFIKSSTSVSSTLSVIVLRALAFLICAYLVATSLFEFPGGSVVPSGPQTLSGGVVPPKPQTVNESSPNSSDSESGWLDLLQPLRGTILEQGRHVWQCGRDYPMLVVSAGMMTCLTAIFLAGPGRLRGIDAFSLFLWVISLIFLLAEGYLGSLSGWLNTLKLTLICICCLFNFTAAAVTRKPQGYRRARYRRSETQQ